jgi:hypothetical protein
MSSTRRFFDGFAWSVPTNFADALAGCAFTRGDILYDSVAGYLPWAEATKRMRWSVQVLSASSTSATRHSGVFESNFIAPISCVLTNYPIGSSSTVATTQGHLYTLLWRGMPTTDDWHARPVTSPLGIVEGNKGLESVADTARRLAKTSSHLFLLAHDLVGEISRQKLAALRDLCGQETILTSAQLGHADGFAPTIRFSVFAFSSSEDKVLAGLKEALYTPSAADRFRLRSHGLFLPAISS